MITGVTLLPMFSFVITELWLAQVKGIMFFLPFDFQNITDLESLFSRVCN